MTKTTNTEITFELFGTTYTRKANGYCFKACEQSESGKIHRIGKAEFETKYAEYGAMEKTLTEIESEEIAEAVKEIREEPKAKKTTKKAKKNAFFTSVAAEGVTLTEKQVSFILHLSDTCFWENGLDSYIWVDVLCDEIGGQFEGKPMTVGAMISTICEKGLGSRGNDRRDGRKVTFFQLTDLGKIVAAELGLE